MCQLEAACMRGASPTAARAVLSRWGGEGWGGDPTIWALHPNGSFLCAHNLRNPEFGAFLLPRGQLRAHANAPLWGFGLDRGSGPDRGFQLLTASLRGACWVRETGTGAPNPSKFAYSRLTAGVRRSCRSREEGRVPRSEPEKQSRLLFVRCR